MVLGEIPGFSFLLSIYPHLYNLINVIRRYTALAVPKMKPIDDTNVQTLAHEIFQIIEDNYVRRSEYEAVVTDLNDRLEVLETIYTYQPTITNNGYLTLFIPDTEDPSVDVNMNEQGYAILTMDDGVTSDLEDWEFAINSDDDLTLTV